MMAKDISGWIEFYEPDIDILRDIMGDSITEIRKSDYPTHRTARFENAPVAILDKLTPYWGQFEWIIDGQ
jgi:hypothetical protein